MLKLAVKQCYQTGQFHRIEMPKLKTSNETFWVIFKHCEVEGASKDVSLFFESLEKHFRRRV